MNRYLINISYIGTKFRGIQRIANKLEPRLTTETIQDCLELALRRFHPVNEIQTILSSRTDAGVHALHSTIHVDLQRSNLQPYSAEDITSVLNRNLAKNNLAIRVLSTKIVPQTFHCRYNAIARTYIYRIAVAKSGILDFNPLRKNSYESFVPIEEIDRCYFLQNGEFDIEKYKSASRLFCGRHDFRTFMSTSRSDDPRCKNPMYTVRSIYEINVKAGRSLCIGSNLERAEELYDFWNIEITGRSFLYKQVRRIVGTLMRAACGLISEKEIYEMLTVPSKYSWNPRILLAPPFGLYLSKIHYNEEDLNFPTRTDEIIDNN